ncbi:MAM and LDL-receptor class A domain-containing protein, partial [Elysia marginata]
MHSHACAAHHSERNGDKAAAAGASCDFEGDCASQWRPNDNPYGNWKWQLRNGLFKLRPPYLDHTKRSPLGHFLYVYVEERFSKSSTKIIGPEFDRRHDSRGPNCFTFWYMMHGAQVPKLSAYFTWPGGRNWALWTRKGDQGPGWHQAYVETSYPRYQKKGHIEFSVLNTVTGSVAIDDVQVYDGPCPGIDKVCDFEHRQQCGFESPSREWYRGQASTLTSLTGLATDHSTNTPSGYYIYLRTLNERGPNFGFKSIMYPPTDGRCLKFYYSVSTSSSSSTTSTPNNSSTNNSSSDNNILVAMDVMLAPETGNMSTIHQVPRVSTHGQWMLYETNVVSSTNFQIVFSARPDAGVISLDDVQMSTSACPKSYGCDFEQGLCSWNLHQDDHRNLDWHVTSGHIARDRIGPYRDITLNSRFGHFLFLQTSNQSESGDLAVLTSQEMTFDSCVTFYYSLMGDGTGLLAVNVTNLQGNSPPQTIWQSKSENKGMFSQWSRAEVDVEATPAQQTKLKTFQLSLIGTVGDTPGADIAVDEIKVYPQRCSTVNAAEKVMVGCSRSQTGQTIEQSQVCDSTADCEAGEDEEDCH